VKVYLAGPIHHATKSERDEWRFEAQARLESLGHTVWLPLEMVEYCREMGLPDDINLHCHIITVRDRWFSTKADVLLVNFDSGGVQVPSIGTCIELGWANASQTHIVGIISETNVHNHPMIDALLDFRVNNLEDGLKVVEALGEGWTKKPVWGQQSQQYSGYGPSQSFPPETYRHVSEPEW
jgi:nucleoside 2-deoxyribosyltransferase